MAEVTVDDGQLVISLSVPERVFSLHGGSVIIPLEQIRRVRVVRNVIGHLRGVRMPGAAVPGRTAIGTWHGLTDGREFRDFVLIRRPGPGVVIATSGEYDRVLLDSDEPQELAAKVGRS